MIGHKPNNELDAHDLREIRLRAIRGEAGDPKTVERMADELATLRCSAEYLEGAAANARADAKAAHEELRRLRERGAR